MKAGAEFDHYGKILEILDRSFEVKSDPKRVLSHLNAALTNQEIPRIDRDVLHVIGRILFDPEHIRTENYPLDK